MDVKCEWVPHITFSIGIVNINVQEMLLHDPFGANKSQ